MITYKIFVKSLGEHARKYTPKELKQLHIDVRRMAMIVVEIHKSRRKSALPTKQER
jgi:hypothetical protein